MEKQKKRSFLTLVTAFLLVFGAGLMFIMATSVKETSAKAIWFSIGAPTLCLGLYYIYVFIRGDKGNTANAEDDVSRQLRLLNDLYTLDILSEEEFSEKKRVILD